MILTIHNANIVGINGTSINKRYKTLEIAMDDDMHSAVYDADKENAVKVIELLVDNQRLITECKIFGENNKSLKGKINELNIDISELRKINSVLLGKIAVYEELEEA